MKLLAKNNLLFFQLTSLLIIIGSILFYLSINYIIRDELDKKLKNNHARVIEQVASGKPFPQFPPKFEVQKLDHLLPQSESLADTLVFDPIEKEEEFFRQLSTITTINDESYLVTVRTSLVEAEDLLFAIGIIASILFVLLLAGLYWLNRRQVARLWSPFQQNLAILKTFSLTQTTPLQLVKSDIAEFEELRIALQQLTQKVRTDYLNLKEFTENASHEIQTPLAIIRSKIEDLIEQEGLSIEQIDSIQQIYKASNRLSRLNQNLLLLAKIENRQFEDVAPISFDKLIREELSFLFELIDSRSLQMKLDMQLERTIMMSKTLAEILVKNLLENAIRHCKPGETIQIVTGKGRISFANSGEKSIPEPEKLFKRFHRRANNSRSMGLGLAIVDKIAGIYGFKVGYQFGNQFHEFYVCFNEIKN